MRNKTAACTRDLNAECLLSIINTLHKFHLNASTKQNQFQSVLNHRQGTKTPFNSLVPKPPFFPSFTRAVTLNPRRTRRKDSQRFKHETRLLIVNSFHISVRVNNTQQRNYYIFRKGRVPTRNKFNHITAAC